ncbi:urb2/Npa2 family domain-containing protein [Trichoderma breve]|uniref:Urb2/Npa2 family domain-containing protein n=1 Tax=Trichoderma breve TaxID=2034170 RepID=A0A9W9BEK5_9HYPO|nr:urb2/Npa2 family domain-containing protein [Trichoderma breve]KAJ4860954.1 urb2/Npa2 family domain-containing protein [Trichoderma breve]
MGKLDLIKTVRGLDQNGPGGNGENLEKLWSNLTEASDHQFHAAEESALRWLLKSMNGSSPEAETIRRYPLTWTILDFVFQKIPLFSLAKSLADRKFAAVLQQTLKDASNPGEEAGGSGGKRKRSLAPLYALDELKGLEGCLATGQAVFNALKSLLGRLENNAVGSRDRIGAEHIKSLFSTSATEAATLSSSFFIVCVMLLASDICDDVEGKEDWVSTVSKIWDLHLQGDTDALEIATHLFRPAAAILRQLEPSIQGQNPNVNEALATRWSADLQRFMHRNFILPARTYFWNRQDFEVISRALGVSDGKTRTSAPALYFLAAGMPDVSTESDLRRINTIWMNRIFKAVEEQIRTKPDRNALMKRILAQAVGNSVAIDAGDLRHVCRNYGLGSEIDWSLLASAATCNPDIFQMSEEGTALLNDICSQSISQQPDPDVFKDQLDLIAAIKKSFQTRRDLSGFLRLWFSQLCLTEKRKLASSSPWFDIGREGSRENLISSLIESELSPHQLLGIVEWLGGQEPGSYPQSLCVFTSVIAQGLHSEQFIDAIGMKLFDLVSQLKNSSKTALKWRVISKAISWTSPEERKNVWDQVKDQLSKLLRKGAIKSAETFEALKCCYEAWDSMSQDEDAVDESSKLVEKFTQRLVEELASYDILEITKLSASLGSGARTEFDEELAFQQYLAWYILGGSRFSRLYSRKTDEFPLLETVSSAKDASPPGLHALWSALLSNDANLNDAKLSRKLLDRLITALAESEKEKGWPGERGQLWIRTLCSVPLEAFSRTQREQIMGILDKRREKMVKSPKRVSLEGWKLVLDLASKMMARPTFYEGMRFSNLVDYADAISSLSFEETINDETLLELVERYFAMASTIVRQMSDNFDERSAKYFSESLAFIETCETEETKSDPLSIPALRITLLKAIIVELSRSSTLQSQSSLSQLQQNAKSALTRHIAAVLGELIADKTFLSKHDNLKDLGLFATTHAADVMDSASELSQHKSSAIRKLEKRSKEAMDAGDLRAWKIQIFLHKYLASGMEDPRPTQFTSLANLPSKARESLLREYITSITANIDVADASHYLKELISEFTGGCDTDGQALAIQHVVTHLIERTDLHGKGEGVDLSIAHSELTISLLKKSPNVAYTCQTVQTLLEKKPQAMGQWNIEVTLSTVSDLALSKGTNGLTVPFAWLCKLVGTIIKKHRLRLEGHHHLLLTTVQALLNSLILNQPKSTTDGTTQEVMARLYGRLITLICEPTAGAVSRSQHQNALDSATDAAKRSAGRHVYLVLMQYVKLQLEADVPREVGEALEPAMNSIFDVTPPEVRKILNDAMDASGRAILREMFKRYVKFGKWSGV